MTACPNFLKQYHAAMIKALGEDAKKINAKVGSIMAYSWADTAGKINNAAEFAQSFENYLKDVLEFADHVKVNCDDKNYTLDVKGCIICHGNEILRKEGVATACPIVQAAKYAAVKKLGKNLITKGVDKPGIVGECTIKYEFE
ncbi:MAG: hypothetical protein KKD69_05760 [Euryarchaeota archaeon]|nr:hypothetical protein [Euryarchaeota archaeon]MCG2728579.1 hypothetical protein [Candidatus Methanoperedenaceae archaeon]